MIEHVAVFYRGIADVETVGSPKGMLINWQLKRHLFAFGSLKAADLLIARAAKAVFYLLTNLCTCFCSKNYREKLSNAIKDMAHYALAIPIGVLGVIFPVTFADKILGIKSEFHTFEDIASKKLEKRLRSVLFA